MKSVNPSPVRHVVSSREMLALATFATAAAHAQQSTTPPPADSGERKRNDGDVLSDLVVSADQERTYNPEKLSSNKLPAPLLDTPQTLSVIPKEVFNQQGARNLAEVLRNTPGISYDAGENGFGTNMNNFSMRGVSSAGSVFFDGVRDSGSYMRDVFNVERVEVAKGPAAENGRNTAGGYVNLVTKTPGLQNFYSGTASYSFDETDASGRFRTSFDANQAINGSPIQGTAIRLNALFQEGGIAGRDFAEQNSWGIAPSLAFGLGTDTRLILAYQHLETNDIPDWGVPSGVSAGGANRFRGVSRSGRDIYYGLTSDYDDTVSDSFIARFEHDFANGLRFTNQTRIAKTERDSAFTMPHSYDNAAQTTVRQERTRYNRENFSFSNLSNFLYDFQTGSLEHTLSAGFEYAHEESDAKRYGSAFRSTSATDPNNNPAGFAVPVYGGIGEVTIDTVSLYAYDTIKFNDRWLLTAGLNVDYYDVELVDKNAAGVEGRNSYKKDETTVGGKIGLVYKPAENGSVYAAVSLSALPPGSFLSNSDASRSGDNGFPGAGAGINSKDARTQENLNYEIGTKWDFCDGRLSATAAIFRTERRNVAVTGRYPGETVTTLKGYGEQILEGIELGLAGQITEEWSIFGGVLFMDSERRMSDRLDAARRLADPNDYGTYTSADGDELAFTPNYSANLWTTYRFPFGLTLGGGLQYVSSSYIGRPDDAERIIPNGRYGKLPDYIVFNALVGYEINENVTVRLNVDNVFDEVYAVSSNWSGVRSTLGPPRTFTISADWTF